jgi:hypothetical protein
MKKYRTTKKYANGGTTPGGKPVKVAGATVVAPKGAGVKKQTYGTDDYVSRQKQLMDEKAAAYLKKNPSVSKTIPDTQRRMMQDEVRAQLTKEGVRQPGMAFKDTGKRLTPEQEKYARERMSRR